MINKIKSEFCEHEEEQEQIESLKKALAASRRDNENILRITALLLIKIGGETTFSDVELNEVDNDLSFVAFRDEKKMVWVCKLVKKV